MKYLFYLISSLILLGLFGCKVTDSDDKVPENSQFNIMGSWRAIKGTVIEDSIVNGVVVDSFKIEQEFDDSTYFVQFLEDTLIIYHMEDPLDPVFYRVRRFVYEYRNDSIISDYFTEETDESKTSCTISNNNQNLLFSANEDVYDGNSVIIKVSETLELCKYAGQIPPENWPDSSVVTYERNLNFKTIKYPGFHK